MHKCKIIYNHKFYYSKKNYYTPIYMNNNKTF